MTVEYFKERAGYSPRGNDWRDISKARDIYDGNDDLFCQEWRDEYLTAKGDIIKLLCRQMIAVEQLYGKVPEYYALKEVLDIF